MNKQYFLWVSNSLLILGSISLLSTTIASTSLSPWIAFFLANSFYMWDAIKTKQWPLVGLCSFYAIWDILLTYSRYTHSNVFDFFTPILTILERLP